MSAIEITQTRDESNAQNVWAFSKGQTDYTVILNDGDDAFTVWTNRRNYHGRGSLKSLSLREMQSGPKVLQHFAALVAA